jgi:hypothetical protein
MDSIKKVLALFNSYMTNRTQQVQIGNALSNKCPLKYGVHNQIGHHVEDCILLSTYTYILRYVFQLLWI